MKGLNYITSKQRIWATRKGLNLTGSKGERGDKNYLNPLENNLWGGEGTLTAIEAEFNVADGQELKGNGDALPKMSALHSSSALAVNVFQYWREKSRDITPLAAACGLCRGDNQYKKTIKFEEKFSIFDEAECSKSTRHPNIDVVIHVEQNGERVFAIESKFTEPYYYKHEGIKEKYLAADVWKDIPETHKLAKRICPNDNLFQHFHAAQLIKHILGLKKHHTAKKGFRLLYLWYDVLGDEGAKHHAEIEQFAEVVKKDEIDFLHLTYQELISKLAEEHRVGNEEYIDYLTERYL